HVAPASAGRRVRAPFSGSPLAHRPKFPHPGPVEPSKAAEETSLLRTRVSTSRSFYRPRVFPCSAGPPVGSSRVRTRPSPTERAVSRQVRLAAQVRREKIGPVGDEPGVWCRGRIADPPGLSLQCSERAVHCQLAQPLSLCDNGSRLRQGSARLVYCHLHSSPVDARPSQAVR